MECRERCGACCIAPSISSILPGMPDGKPANVRCIHLNERFGCQLFGLSSRPRVCGSLKPDLEMCGNSRSEALQYLAQLEMLTS